MVGYRAVAKAFVGIQGKVHVRSTVAYAIQKKPLNQGIALMQNLSGELVPTRN